MLLEVNVSGEESKYGILPAAAETFLERAAAYRRVRFVGLMTMAPLVDDPEEATALLPRVCASSVTVWLPRSPAATSSPNCRWG